MFTNLQSKCMIFHMRIIADVCTNIYLWFMCGNSEIMPSMYNRFHKLKKKLVVHLPRLDNRLLISLSANKLFILAILAPGLCIISCTWKHPLLMLIHGLKSWRKYKVVRTKVGTQSINIKNNHRNYWPWFPTATAILFYIIAIKTEVILTNHSFQKISDCSCNFVCLL